MSHTTKIMKKSIIAASFCCLLFLATPITADRAGTPIDFDDSADEAGTPLIDLKKVKSSANQIDKQYVLDGYVTADGKYLLKPKNKSRGSLLIRSFLLASLFWAVKFVLPQIYRYWSERQGPSSRGRGRKRGKSRGDNEESTVVTTDHTVSPSVMELLEMGNDFGDDGASFITAGTTGTAGTFATYLSSLVSRYRSRGRAEINPLARFNPSGRKSKSAPAANSSQIHHDHNHQSSVHKKKSKQLDLSKISKRHHHEDEAPNSHLHFIDEDTINNGASRHHKGSKKQSSYNLDDASHIPSTGRAPKEDHGYNPKQRHKKSDPSSPLEQKLGSALRPASEDFDHIHYNKQGNKEKHYHKKNSNEGRHRHRDRLK